MALGVDEASQAYERTMRNIAVAGPGICRVCVRWRGASSTPIATE